MMPIIFEGRILHHGISQICCAKQQDNVASGRRVCTTSVDISDRARLTSMNKLIINLVLKPLLPFIVLLLTELTGQVYDVFYDTHR
jgi:hypothetical protein